MCSVQICSLIRGSIGERSGIRIGHRIIDINGTSTVNMSHQDVVHLLSCTVGDVSNFLHIDSMKVIQQRTILCSICNQEYWYNLTLIYGFEHKAYLINTGLAGSQVSGWWVC